MCFESGIVEQFHKRRKALLRVPDKRGSAMELKISQEIAQQQKLILTPDMRQSLKVLQMPLPELQQDIIQELEDNPLLEVSIEPDNAGDEALSPDTIIDKMDFLTQGPGSLKEDDFTDGRDEGESMDPFDYAAVKPSLKDFLKEQLLDLDEKKAILIICDYIIENVDEKGYLDCTIEDITAGLGAPPELVNEALALVQDLEPAGVAARDLKECLKIQLRKKEITSPVIYRMVDEYLELIAANKLRELAKQLNLEIGQVQQYCQIIRTLEPKPARGFFSSESGYVLPEAYIIRNQQELLIVMNESALPKLTINQLYRNIIHQQEDPAALDFVKAKLTSAMLLLSNIEHRKRTIFAILETITEFQKDYFLQGEAYLRPMTIANIAGRLHIHESTVSRAIRDKYICTPFRTVKLKDLFTGGISSGEVQ
ncbi:MAG TPA: RNA polymerase sigma-54 factor, partial [Firmicutes bacterium]|nr:RNA polymerase sigma-54 factor [Bacillota bacterium]